eukprot:CAMPEP_0171150898 /NCGR_PEP_ID=MMETSP0766_2-20121228/149800_1 /TAXON_ID=439317 /ORGANISM="Gambierdiscus australes, Strain CAWD 149" /LENGTH=134 /DNA_ID=CAMNT_0011614811 /DNA_START=330 /DNA_END=731 /DNA_ORIENTATION=+
MPTGSSSSALQRLVDRFTDVYRKEWCDPDADALLDWEMQAFVAKIITTNDVGLCWPEPASCSARTSKSAPALSPAGTDLWAPSATTRPRPRRVRQHMILFAIAAFMATGQPKFRRDFTHILAGIHRALGAVKRS